MGRPPIGKVAMTDAERQRRRRERLAAKPGTPPFRDKPHVTKASPATHRQAKPEPQAEPAVVAQLKARIAELEQERDRYRHMAESGGDQQLKDRIAKLEADVRRSKRGFIWTMQQYRDIEFCTHPDRVAHLKDEALSQRFNAAFRTVKSSKGIVVDPAAEKHGKQDERFLDEWREAIAKRRAKLRAREAERRANAKAQREARSAALRKAAADRKAKRAAAEAAR